MKATEARLLNFLGKSSQFVIPIYQRTYSWTKAECLQLWNDILDAGRNKDVKSHFIGSVVYVENGLYSVSLRPQLLVVDGQQRLTTVLLLIEALARNLGSDELEPDFSAQKLRNYYLRDAQQTGERTYKLLLSTTDKASLNALVDGAPQPPQSSIRIYENFYFFKEWLEDLGDEEDLKSICRGLAKLVIVDISLERAHDNPQLIFESLNSTGSPLNQADLIRNYVLMGLEHDEQSKLYQDYWYPMEQAFGQENYTTDFDKFVRHYLTFKTGEIPKTDKVYKAFQNYATTAAYSSDVRAILADMRLNAERYCRIALDAEQHKDLKDAFKDIQELKAEVTYPFMLRLYDDYDAGLVTADEFIEIIRLIDSFIFRRAVCGRPTNALNKIFASFGSKIQGHRYLDSAKGHFATMPGQQEFPEDTEFMTQLTKKRMYNIRPKYWTRRLENYGRKERVLTSDYTIEHIMPQSVEHSSSWQAALGPNWKALHESYVHTLGNLTLTAYNSEYSNRSFYEKRNMTSGFKESPLRLNTGLGILDEWNEEEIQKRAKRLAVEACDVWKFPHLLPDVLMSFKAQTTPNSVKYSVASHPFLALEKPRQLFQAFRKQTLSIDQSVTESFNKLCVTYGVDRHFVSIIPLKSGLRLVLNIPFQEIIDPANLAEDISNVGHWGNGDTQVRMTTLNSLPDIMRLVHQAYAYKKIRAVN